MTISRDLIIFISSKYQYSVLTGGKQGEQDLFQIPVEVFMRAEVWKAAFRYEDLVVDNREAWLHSFDCVF